MSTLTLIFITLKLIGEISWSWWLVFLPTIIEIALIIIITAISIFIEFKR